MTYLLAIFYGIVQGVTEFLPVSSSGHLSLFQSLLHTPGLETDYFTFDILLHLATLAAVFIVYRRDIGALIPAFFTMLGKLFRGRFRLACYSAEERFVIMAIIATLPLAAAVVIGDWVELLYSVPKVIGAILILNGVMLFLSDLLAGGNRSGSDLKPRNAIVIGLFQLCALLPGLSRSGSTITGGLTQKLSRENAVKFSFILSIPAILGANVMKVPDLLETPVPQNEIGMYLAGMAAAFAAGIAAMKLLIYIARRASFKGFGVYCVLAGVAALIFIG